MNENHTQTPSVTTTDPTQPTDQTVWKAPALPKCVYDALAHGKALRAVKGKIVGAECWQCGSRLTAINGHYDFQCGLCHKDGEWIPMEKWAPRYGLRVVQGALFRYGRHVDESEVVGQITKFGDFIGDKGSLIAHLKANNCPDIAEEIRLCSITGRRHEDQHGHSNVGRIRCHNPGCVECSFSDARAELRKMQECLRDVAKTNPDQKIRTARISVPLRSIMTDPLTDAPLPEGVWTDGHARALMPAVRAVLRRFNEHRRKIQARGFGQRYTTISADGQYVQLGFWTTGGYKEVEAIFAGFTHYPGAITAFGPTILAKDGFPPTLDHEPLEHPGTRIVFPWICAGVGSIHPGAHPQIVLDVILRLKGVHMTDGFGVHARESVGDPPETPDPDDGGEDKTLDAKARIKQHSKTCAVCKSLTDPTEDVQEWDPWKSAGWQPGWVFFNGIWRSKKEAKAIWKSTHPDPPRVDRVEDSP